MKLAKIATLLLSVCLLFSLFTACGFLFSDGNNTGTPIFSNKANTWVLNEFTDEFNQPTGEKYISTEVKGTFSNSATTDSKLKAEIIITSNALSIKLWEYGSSLVKCSYGTEIYRITLKDESGNKYYYVGYMIQGTSEIIVPSKDEIIDIFLQNDSLSFYVEMADRTVTNYLFTVETGNLENIYSGIK